MRRGAGLLAPSIVLSWLSVVLGLAPVCAPAQAQDAGAQPAPLAIVDARVDGHDGPVVLMVQGGKVRAIAPGRRAPPLPGLEVLDAGGGRVVPGRIDAFASLGQPDPLGRALDAFDPFDAEATEQALAAGVTSVLLNPRRAAGLCGVASLVKLDPSRPLAERVVIEEAALCSSLGLGADGPVERAAHAVALRKQLEGAVTYRDAWLDYEEDLEKYEEELAKHTEKNGKQAGGKNGKNGKGKNDKKGKDGKKDKGPKKPKRPPVDRAKALLVRALDRELPLRIEAHRQEDIANALELQAAFGFRLILEGATEGWRFAEVLAEREVPVILGPLLRPSLTSSFFPAAYRAETPALLRAAGVTLAIGSDSWEATPTLPANAALAASASAAEALSPAEVEATLTRAPAEILGVADRLGRVAPGYEADLVVLEPAALGALRVAATIVDGAVVYRRQP